jgi:hypothetical protein
MVETGQVAHARPDGSTPRSRAIAAGYPTTEVSENIYGGTNASVNDAWNFWMNSRIHYAGMTNARYKEVGIGIARGGWGTAYVLVFGNPGGPEYVPPQAAAGKSGGAAAPPSFVVGLDAHGNIMHEIQPGDTLGDIALIYGYTWGDIPYMLELNGLTQADIRELEIGAIFLVPPKAGTYTPTPGDPAAAATPPAPEPTASATPTPEAPPTGAPEPSLSPPTATFAPPVITAVSVPVGLDAALTSTTTAAPQVVAMADVPAEALSLEQVQAAGTVVRSSGPSPWLVIGLTIQVIVLLAAGVEFIRRARRR